MTDSERFIVDITADHVWLLTVDVRELAAVHREGESIIMVIGKGGWSAQIHCKDVAVANEAEHELIKWWRAGVSNA